MKFGEQQPDLPDPALSAALPPPAGMQPAHSLRKDLFPHHPPAHLLYEPRRSVRDRASQHLMQPPSSRGPAMSRACPRPRLKKLVTSWALKLDSHGAPSDDVGLDAGSSRREGTGLWGWLWGGVAISPCVAGLCSFTSQFFSFFAVRAQLLALSAALSLPLRGRYRSMLAHSIASASL